MNMREWLVNAARRLRRRSESHAPRPGMLLRPSPEGVSRSYPADGLSPERLIAIVREADAGSPETQWALFEQMEEKDAHLYSVAQTRRLAVTGLAWEIVSAADAGSGRRLGQAGSAPIDRRAADAAADHCREVLERVEGLETALAHLALAVGRNLSVVELVWEPTSRGPRLSELAPVEFERLTMDRAGELRIRTRDQPQDGIVLAPDKFIVHRPHAVAGHPARGGLSRVTALAYVAKHFAIKDWLIFAEVFGMPVRIARYAPNATPEEKRELLRMLQSLGADATAIFSKAVEVEIKQTRVPGETNLYENLCLYFDREISKAWLGQTLTTDVTRTRASTGVATVHDRVRQDLRDDDLRQEAATLRRDLLAPLTRMEFGPGAPVPHFRRVVDLGRDPEKLGRVLATAVNELGVRVPAAWAHAALGIPEARAGEAVVGGNVETSKNRNVETQRP